MHQGNLFVDNNGNIVPVDFGIMGRLDKHNKKYLAEILVWIYKRDYVKVAEVHFQAGLVPNTASKEEFAQALNLLVNQYLDKILKIYLVVIYYHSYLKLPKNLIWLHKHSFYFYKKLWS